MKASYAFFKKELLEYARTYKLLIMLVVFAVFGMLSPLAAKFLPDLMASLMAEGVTITLPDPLAADAWAQFVKNIAQTCLFVTVILFSGAVSGEISKGTLVNMLTKGLGRGALIRAKFAAMSLVWTISYLAAFAVCFGYTAYLFPGGAVSNLAVSVFCLWLWGIFLLAALLFGSSLVKSAYGALLVAGGLLVALTLLNLAPAWKPYNPLSLAENNTPLLSGAIPASELLGAALIAAAASLLLVAAAHAVFKRRQL